VKRIGRELGVRYILEGSVRKAGSRVRITGQLIDASLGAHIWAGRFDGELENIFDLQDQVTASVVGQIAPKLEAAEIERATRKPTASLDAYDYYLRGMACVHRWTREANKEALHLFDRAIEIDPNFAAAYGMAARCYSQRKVSGWVADRPGEIAEAKRLARRAAELGKQDAVALCTAGIVLAYVAGELEEGDALIDRALQLNPNWAWAWLFSGWAKVWLGEPEIAIERVQRAMRLSPQDPQFFNMQTAAAWAHFLAGQYAEAMSWSQTAVRVQADYVSALRVLAASSALNDRLAQAREVMARVRQLDPDSRISTILERDPLRRPQDLERFAEGLRRAGLPE
jgi:tetratricopeptide (TPR) repeat protein